MEDYVKELVSSDKELKTMDDEIGSDIKYWYPTNCPPLDAILGGGVAGGRIYEVYGWESVGKTTIALTMAKAFLDFWESRGEKCSVLWIESETSIDRVRASYMGVNMKKFVTYETLILEDGFDRAMQMLEKCKERGIHLFIGWDTIAATKTKNEIEKGEFAGGRQEKPRVIGDRATKLVKLLSDTGSTMVFLNQCYAGDFGELISKGGKAIKYLASTRILVSRASDMVRMTPNGESMNVGIVANVHTRKNKLMYPKQTVQVPINGETGLENFEGLVMFLQAKKLIEMKGSWKYVTFNEKKYSFQSSDKLKQICEEVEPKMFDYLKYLVYLHYSKASPLIKVRLIKELWTMEEHLFGEKKTTLIEKETELAELIYKEIRDVGNN